MAIQRSHLIQKKLNFSCKVESLLKSASKVIIVELQLPCMSNSSHFPPNVELIFPINSTQSYISIVNQFQKLTLSKSILHPFFILIFCQKHLLNVVIHEICENIYIIFSQIKDKNKGFFSKTNFENSNPILNTFNSIQLTKFNPIHLHSLQAHMHQNPFCIHLGTCEFHTSRKNLIYHTQTEHQKKENKK